MLMLSISLNHMTLEMMYRIISNISITLRWKNKKKKEEFKKKSFAQKCAYTKPIILPDDSISTASGVASAGEDRNFFTLHLSEWNLIWRTCTSAGVSQSVAICPRVDNVPSTEAPKMHPWNLVLHKIRHNRWFIR